jgi:pimeloyl-ACP methyl ester carboxylesterase
MTQPRALLSVLAVLVGLASGSAVRAEEPVSQTFMSNGVKIHYFVQGKGEPVILIHGWLSSAGINWRLTGVSDLLARDHQVIAMDVRGHGMSDRPTKEEAYGAELVEDVARLMDHLKISKAHIVGYSMGGIITGNFIAKHPDRALSGTLGGMGWVPAGAAAQLGFGGLGKPNANDAPGLCFRSLGKLGITEQEVKAIKVPMTMIVGDNDDLIKKLYVEPAKKVRTDWTVTEIKDANHITCIMKPDFKEAIAAWIKKNSK